MIDDRPQADRILVAQLTGEARHCAKWRELTGYEEAAAVIELADGRADLLAEVAGILEGVSDGIWMSRSHTRPRGCSASPGADPGAIPAWIEEGRRRRAATRMRPFSGGHPPRP